MILVLSGPNLNLLGQREPQLYGKESLADIHKSLETLAKSLKVAIECQQTNHEGTLIDWLQTTKADAIVMNAGGLTHTSVALRDTVAAIAKPVVEVHLTHIFAREPFRRTSLLAEVCAGMVSGFGSESYRLGLRAAANLVTPKTRQR